MGRTRGGRNFVDSTSPHSIDMLKRTQDTSPEARAVYHQIWLVMAQLPRLVVWTADAVLVLDWLAVFEDELEDVELAEDEVDAAVAVLATSSAIAVVDAFVAVDAVPDDAAVVVVPGAWAANQVPSPTNVAALRAPVTRRARRAGCGFFMPRACAPAHKMT